MEILFEVKKSKWVLLRNVFRAVVLFKYHEARVLDDFSELVKEIEKFVVCEGFGGRRVNQCGYLAAVNELRKIRDFEDCVQRGSLEDIEIILQDIKNDPFYCLKYESHPFALVNKRNSYGQTPLYVACKNGNFELVNKLLAFKADHRMTVEVDGELESCLEVAVRWMHCSVVKLLLSKDWSKRELKKAKRICRTKEIQLLFDNLGKRKKQFCCVGKR